MIFLIPIYLRTEKARAHTRDDHKNIVFDSALLSRYGLWLYEFCKIPKFHHNRSTRFN